MPLPDVVVHLSFCWKPRNNQEGRWVNRVICEEFREEIVGDGYIVEAMAHRLHEKKCDLSRGYKVLRGDTPCFTVVPLKSWVYKKDTRPEWLRKGSPKRQSKQ